MSRDLPVHFGDERDDEPATFSQRSDDSLLDLTTRERRAVDFIDQRGIARKLLADEHLLRNSGATLPRIRRCKLPQLLGVAVRDRMRDFRWQLAERMAPKLDLLRILVRPVLGPDVVERQHETLRVAQHERAPLGHKLVARKHVGPGLAARAAGDRVCMRSEKDEIRMRGKQLAGFSCIELRYVNEGEWVLGMAREERPELRHARGARI